MPAISEEMEDHRLLLGAGSSVVEDLHSDARLAAQENVRFEVIEQAQDEQRQARHARPGTNAHCARHVAAQPR